MNKDKVFLSWKWVEKQLDEIGDRLDGLDKIEFVTGIPRGGLIPAVMMSHAFNFKYISYSSAKLLPKDIRKNVICIDDISDTGHTLIEAKELESGMTFSIIICFVIILLPFLLLREFLILEQVMVSISS